MLKMNYYQILDLEPSCTSEQIKTQYRILAHKYHPDKHKGNHKYVERFMEVQKAYEILINNESRSKYDILNATYQKENDDYADKNDSVRDEISIPYIIYFQCNSVEFTIGEPITFNWKVSGADYIAIEPFGRIFEKESSKTVKINTYVEVLKVKIIAKNTHTGEFVVENIHLNGKRPNNTASARDRNSVPIENEENILKKKKEENEKMTLFEWGIVFIVILGGVLLVAGIGTQALAFLTSNDYYESDAFFYNIAPYIGAITLFLFIYAVYDACAYSGVN